MNTTLQETFEYRHKKFDQSKRMRSDSLSSSSTDYGNIKLENELTRDESPCHETTFQHSSGFSWCFKKTTGKRTLSTTSTDDFAILPAAKKPRLSSFSPNIRLHTSTPLTVADAVVPPTAAILPKISEETLHSICKYHGNMVRKFPKKERTPKDQERRNKNTVACRMSRRVKKLEHIAIEEQYKEFYQQTFDIIEQSMRATAYLHELIKLKSCSQAAVEEAQTSKMLNEKTFASAPQKKPFTIEFLLGNKLK